MECVAFQIYKPNQGRYVRWGTVGFAAVIIAFGMLWLSTSVLGTASVVLKASVASAFGVLGLGLVLYLVNRPGPAEFMIMTESEMRKVNWPTRKTVMNATKVVIVMTLLMAAILGVVDAGFIWLFRAMGIIA